MLERFRGLAARALTPLARLLLRIGATPDLITCIGTLGVLLGAMIFFPNGWFLPGVIIVTFFVLFDMLDGQMAKISGRASRWGAFLDSSLDRIGDGAVFGGVVLYFVGRDGPMIWPIMAVWALVAGQLTSYVKARAESLGFTAPGGLAARADRLLVILAALFLAGFGVPYVLEIGLTVLAVINTITVVQRVLLVRHQSRLETDEPTS
ncbi:phosphatidylinositol phosphate synthase [Microlunatus speluncae]|uniref:phosphatidylinositol phosphate synthase n=1 Tax=Microlunatus speluncae TaxID=2594267 RepID=UPI0012661FCD|nr:CDP-alcohol phosphatidyltransferase family protein [Microlunatus speluncae]